MTETESKAPPDSDVEVQPKAKTKAKAKGKAKGKAPSRPSSAGAASVWKRWRVPLIVVLLIVGLTAGGLVGYQSYTAKAERERAEAVQAAASATAASVSREVSRETQALTRIFDEGQLAALLSGDDAGTRIAKEAEIAAASHLPSNPANASLKWCLYR